MLTVRCIDWQSDFNIDATTLQCNHAGVTVNGKAIDLFPKCHLRLCNDGENLVPLDRELLRDDDGNGYWDIRPVARTGLVRGSR